ncbi:Long chain fatty acyl-CoA synthetase [Wickerhamomyces ciferrii]|uniref:Long chain fatty acyl-CoA synthetase n=1 Tax=Wickerhamomyces ciferrii (strain ATCC 14091 / BCRC 22168 / CBS 111 / JCM 3599 / NBRC 0793 / NRRL Y-1031 F-60-10) TaxID=1206466 RepID=K0KTD6_WICCF|nr:Long chain fatty acyl-CoA synthetase [Wickerhamomyces ciferrii]CCH44558.1 Long chain fatty acyl-CoA synthetase [Wickerhamomyces ciferrii]
MNTLTDLNTIRDKFPEEKIYKAVPIQGTEKPGFSPIYRNSASLNKLIPNPSPELNTLHALFENAVRLFGDSDCLGERLMNSQTGKLDDFFTFETYKQINQRKINIASGLINLVTKHPDFTSTESNVDSITGKPKFVVSVSGRNSKEMILTDLATRSFSIPNTGLYESLNDDSAAHILKLSESPVLVCNKNLIPKFLKIKKKYNINTLFLFISYDKLDKNVDIQLLNDTQKAGIDLTDFQYVEEFGESHRLSPDFNIPKPETLYTLAFTSGTTGMPKGVYLTHENATANVTGFLLHAPKPATNLSPEKFRDFRYNKDSRGKQLKTLCFLPLLHNYEKSISNFELSYGIALALPSKPGPKSLFEDLKIVQPSLFTGVPRVFTLIENKIKEFISKAGLSLEKEEAKTQLAVRKEFGLEFVSYLMCASAPISKESIIFLKKSIGCGFLNSYGATECFSVFTFSNPYQVKAGSSGPTGLSCEIKLKDVPEMGYTSSDKPHPRGEVLVRGYCVFSHYYKNEEATKAAIDDEGWYHTGDVVALDESGDFFIIDRVKNFFKLAQGEYVTPERVENIYLANNPLLTQLFVHGDSFSNFLIGIAGINPEAVKAILKKHYKQGDIHSLDTNDLLTLLNDQNFKKIMLEEISKNISKSDLQGYEKLHNLHFDLEPLTIENDALTPSFKLKRSSAKKVHLDKIKRLYTEGSLVKPRTKL